jgi:hypothetical protein
MTSCKHHNSDQNNLSRKSKGYDLWYYERRGNDRLYFRLAPLGWSLIVIAAIVSIMALIILFFYNTKAPLPKTDVTIKPSPGSSDTPSNLEIKPVPPRSSQPQVNRRSNFNSINPLSSPQPSRNINGQ